MADDAIVQDVTLVALLATGLEESCIIRVSDEMLASHGKLAVVATDNVVFIHSDSCQGAKRVEQFDGSLAQYNILRLLYKDQFRRETGELGLRALNSAALNQTGGATTVHALALHCQHN